MPSDRRIEQLVADAAGRSTEPGLSTDVAALKVAAVLLDMTESIGADPPR